MQKTNGLVNSDEVIEVRKCLELMVEDNTYLTEPSFSANTEQYPDNLIPFIDKHLNYLLTHKSVNPQQYLSNLRLMTRLSR